MSFLSGLIDKAQGWLGAKPAPKATDAVVSDRFDHALYQEMLTEVPALGRLADDLNVNFDYTDDLVRDVLMSFFQADPRLRTKAEMDERYLTNHVVASAVATAPETVETRAMSKHSRYAATMATLSVGQKLRDQLAEQTELAEKTREAKEAQQGLDQQNKGLQEAANAALAAQAESDASGDPQGAQQAAEALQAALAQAEAAAADAEAANQAAQDAASAAQQQLRVGVRRAIKEVTEQLDDQTGLFNAWGIGEGELARMSFDERNRLARQLRNNRLSKFVQLLGRFRVMAAAQRARKVEYGRDEVVGVELSDRLADLVPTELVYLASKNRHLRRDFYLRLLEGQVLTRQFRGTEQVGQGAIIACVDCSGSMAIPDGNGITREAWAKSFAFALLDQARAGKRDFVGIIFSAGTQMKTFRFPKGQASISEVLEFVETFYQGGTNFQRPLTEAVDILEADFNTTGRSKADIVLITDDECRVTPEWTKDFQARKAKLGFRMFGVAVGMAEPGGVLNSLSENVRAVQEFADPSVVADMMRMI